MKTLTLFALLFSIQSAMAAPVTVVGSGLRVKKVLFVGIDIYQATLSVSEPNLFVRDTNGNKALDSLKNMKTRTLVLTFKRSVSANTIWDGFESMLKAKGIGDSIAMTEFKKAVKEGGDIKTGDSITFTVDKDKGVLTYQQNHKPVNIKGDEAFFQNVFSIWLGKPTDDGLKELRERLIKG